MIRIGINNYEAFLLDYTEGNLGPELTAELLLFLEQHPELNAGLDDLNAVRLPVETVPRFRYKESLKKTSRQEDTNRFPQLCLAFYDKIITPGEEEELERMLREHPGLKKDFIAFSHTYLQPDSTISYPYTASLKRSREAAPNMILRLWPRYIAAAAVITALILLWPGNGKRNPAGLPALPVAEHKQASSVSPRKTQTSYRSRSSFLASKKTADQPKPSEVKALPAIPAILSRTVIPEIPALAAPGHLPLPGDSQLYAKVSPYDAQTPDTSYPNILEFAAGQLRKMVLPGKPAEVSPFSYKQGFVEQGLGSIEKFSNGAIQFERKETASSRKITRLRIGPLEISRSTKK